MVMLTLFFFFPPPFLFFFRWTAHADEIPTQHAYKANPLGGFNWTFFECPAFAWAHRVWVCYHKEVCPSHQSTKGDQLSCLSSSHDIWHSCCAQTICTSNISLTDWCMWLCNRKVNCSMPSDVLFPSSIQNLSTFVFGVHKSFMTNTWFHSYFTQSGYC